MKVVGEKIKLQLLAFMLVVAFALSFASPLSVWADDGDDAVDVDLTDEEVYCYGGGGSNGISSRTVSTAEFNSWLNKGETNNKVYHAVQDGQSVYTGITKQSIDARLAQHNNAGKDFSRLDVQHDGLTRNQARAVEQYYIENGPSDLNQINSISTSSSYYPEAISWAQQYLNEKE